MSPLTLGLVLASAAIHASWNLWTKQLGSRASRGALMWLLVTISALVYAPVAITLLVSGAGRPDGAAWLLIAGSGVLHALYFLLLVNGYRRGDLSLVYPVARGTGQLLAAIGGVALFAERPSLLWAAGAGLVFTGLAVLTARRGGAPAGRAAAGMRDALTVGGFIGLYTLWDAWAMKHTGVHPIVYYWFGELLRSALFAPAALGDREGVRRLWREERLRVAGVAVLSPLAYVLILAAMRLGPVSHIAPARELSVVFGAWLGGRVLGEGERSRRLVAAASLAAGVIALTWS